MGKIIREENPDNIKIVYTSYDDVDLQAYYDGLGERAEETYTGAKLEKFLELQAKYKDAALIFSNEKLSEVEERKYREEKAQQNETANFIEKPLEISDKTRDIVKDMLKDMNFSKNL